MVCTKDILKSFVILEMPQSLYDYKEILEDLWLMINSTRFMANSQMREVDFIYGVANYDYCIQWKVASYKGD